MRFTPPFAQGIFLLRPDAAHSACRRRRRAFTLIEILVSLVITLMMMGAVVSLFGVMSESVSGSRAIIEMSERLRATRNRVQLDLQGATATMQPPLKPERDEGYFEYIEGPVRDLDWMTFSPPPFPVFPNPGHQAGRLSIFGDPDDVLMFTVRNTAEPFVGKFNGTATLESPLAEVMYFAVPNGPIVDAATNPPTRLMTLYRRVLLIVPSATITLNNNFYDNNDISIRLSGTTFVPSTLGDLTKRENRFAHYAVDPTVVNAGFPFNLNTAISTLAPASQPRSNSAFLIPFDNVRLGDDVLMTNVLSFDVQVYDQNAPIRQSASGGIIVTPTDPGFATSVVTGMTPEPTGAFVDLGYANASTVTPLPLFRESAMVDLLTGLPSITTALAPTLPVNKYGGNMNPPLTVGVLTRAFTFDTWSTHYEQDGIQQNGVPADKGTNGIDDNSNGIVDDPTELDTHAPFAAQIRGVRVIIRAYEPGSQQVREVSIEQDFLPE